MIPGGRLLAWKSLCEGVFRISLWRSGIAEQNLVSIAAGLANCGTDAPLQLQPREFPFYHAAMEQIKVDVAYSHTNVKLIGISGGVSYGALGMTHHSAQDLAALADPFRACASICPSDRHPDKES